MDALKNLTNNIPDWQRRLEELSGQVERRQAELAAVAATGPNAEARSLRNKGSTESLKPKDDGPSFVAEPIEHAAPLVEEPNAPFAKPSTPPGDSQTRQPPASNTGSVSPSALHKTRELGAAAHSRARAQVKRRQRSSSVISGDGIVPAYRTRSMIIVYYDSYVQSFFDDLVRFVSSSRNLMRKAKMAAKVAQIKRMAELEAPDEDATSGDEAALPSLRYMSTRRFGPMSKPGFVPPGGRDQPPDVYDNLDKALEFVQGTCEHGAHQFLRDADCNDEIRKIQKRIADVLDLATKETERVLREEPELAKESGDMGKVRTRRPISMRRDLSASPKDGAKDELLKLEAATIEPKDSSIVLSTDSLEVDTSMEVDEGIAVELPKLQYRSTRYMRSMAN